MLWGRNEGELEVEIRVDVVHWVCVCARKRVFGRKENLEKKEKSWNVGGSVCFVMENKRRLLAWAVIFSWMKERGGYVCLLKLLKCPARVKMEEDIVVI